MPVTVTSFLIPVGGASWFILEDKYLRGGYRVVANTTERDNIHINSKKPGMVVYIQSTGELQKLDTDGLTWVKFTIGYNPFHTHTQAVPSNLWTITHNKNSRYFTHSVFDVAGNSVIPEELKIIDLNTVEVSFSTPIAGQLTLAFAIPG